MTYYRLEFMAIVYNSFCGGRANAWPLFDFCRPRLSNIVLDDQSRQTDWSKLFGPKLYRTKHKEILKILIQFYSDGC